MYRYGTDFKEEKDFRRLLQEFREKEKREKEKFNEPQAEEMTTLTQK